LSMLAQAPQLINYQGVARDGFGVPIVNKTLGMKFELLQGTANTLVFSEAQTITTSSLGLFSTQIGKVNTTAMAAVNYEAGAMSLQVSIDTTGGTNYILASKQNLVSVPFSMHAQTVPVSYTNNILTIGK